MINEAWWRGRRVTVTGAAGFVGAHLMKRLIELGANVMGVDLVASSPPLRALGVEAKIAQRDLATTQDLPTEREVVFHLAGASHILASQEFPQVAWRGNVQATWNVLEWARGAMGGKDASLLAVVVASSNHVYGSSSSPVDESSPTHASDAYGTSKIMVDALVRCYGTSLGLPVCSLRHVNAYGEADPHESHLVTGAICALIRGEIPTLRGNGQAAKGYLYIADVVNAYLLLAERCAAGYAQGEPINAGTTPVASRAMVGAIMELFGRSGPPLVEHTDHSQDTYYEWLDDTRLRRWGWNQTPPEEGLRATLEWYTQKGGMAWLG